MLRRVALVITDVSAEPSASFIRVTRIGELETTIAVTRNGLTLRRMNVTAAGCSQNAQNTITVQILSPGRETAANLLSV
jgi:hypothetical protein